jgi:hypothetical protein
VTFARNSFHNVDSAISFCFGTGHIFNTYFKDVADGIGTRMGAQLLIESSVFEGQGRAVFSEGSTEAGYATAHDVVLDSSSSITAPSGSMTVDSLPYPYNWYIWETETVQESVTRQAGNTLEFMRAAWLIAVTCGFPMSEKWHGLQIERPIEASNRREEVCFLESGGSRVTFGIESPSRWQSL